MKEVQMEYGMARVIGCFPEHAASIRDRFRADRSVREICGDYAETAAALQRWEASSGPHKAARIEESRELAAALEVEIATALRLQPPDTEDHPR
jgi:hypothetical protein